MRTKAIREVLDKLNHIFIGNRIGAKILDEVCEILEAELRERVEGDEKRMVGEWLPSNTVPEPNCIIIAKVRRQAISDSGGWSDTKYHIENEILEWKPLQEPPK